ncbi:hypothetical protein [Halovivax gelatinilyticus]|uniref:hypothetical protein n=1 Tax=Halovivax gelatinilyticus TaxID=2961597 RepID=UPI0020CA3985|nr:hypothetical protein [Halovivax gelatinilyticus]
MSTILSTDDRARTDRPSVAAGAGVGVIAAAIGYLASYLLVRDEVRDNADAVGEWRATAWYYYNAHFVELETSGSFGGLGGSTTVDLVAESSAQSVELLYVIPPLVLLGAGALLAHNLRAGDLGEAVVAGAPVTIGYAVVMSLGVYASESRSEGTFFGVDVTGSVGPELVPAVVLAGVLYPLVFATAGAVLAVLVSGR